jgi:type II secretory pathway component PulJ
MIRRRTDDEGFTVVELMITVALMTVATGILLGFLMSTTSLTASTDHDAQAERDAQLALRVITEDVRAANPILASCGTGYANCLSFKVARPSAAKPDCASTFTYKLAAGVVAQDRADTDCATNRSWTSRPIIQVVNATLPTPMPVFTYADRLDRPITLTQVCSTDPSQPSCVMQARTVRITFATKYAGQKSAPLRFQAAIALRNNR